MQLDFIAMSVSLVRFFSGRPAGPASQPALLAACHRPRPCTCSSATVLRKGGGEKPGRAPRRFTGLLQLALRSLATQPNPASQADQANGGRACRSAAAAAFVNGVTWQPAGRRWLIVPDGGEQSSYGLRGDVEWLPATPPVLCFCHGVN